MTNETKFRPVTGTESSIQKTEKHPGWVYFASDSGKIYFDYDEDNRIVMGGSGATIFYANDGSVYDTGQDTYEIHISELEASTSSPKEDDIIINIHDNCFYRALEVREDDGVILCNRIAVAGTGGPGTGEGSGEAAGSANVIPVTPITLDALYGESCIIEFIVEAKDSAGDNTTGGTVSWTLDKKDIGVTMHVSPGLNRFDVGPYLKNTSGAQVLKGTFSLDVGTNIDAVRTKGWTITTVDVKMSWDYNTSSVVTENNLLLNWTVTGGASVSKTTHIIINGNLEITQEVTKVGAQSISIPRDDYNLNHGKFNFEMFVSYEVNGVTRIAPSITHEIIFIKPENNIPIIALGAFETNVKQYDTVMIPVYIYNSSSAVLYIDGEIHEEWDDIAVLDNEATLRYWSYTPIEAGSHRLVVVCGSVEYPIVLEVESLNLTVEETSGYAFKVKASDFSSNNALRAWKYQTPEKEEVTLTFSDNFDWINGGLQQEEDENGNLRQYICAKAGTYFTINYDLFKAKNTYGKDIKVIFKVTNCGKYDAEVIRSYDDTDNIGLLMTAQEALFHSTSNAIRTQYCEDNYIEYEIDITPFAATGSNNLQYIMPWLAGVPAGITTFSMDSFQQDSRRMTQITVGSEDCDVYLYLFKVYEKHLTNEEHLENFIMDALNSQEIINRYTRNDILSDLGNGEIDWAKVVEKNPDCWVHLYTIPRMTKNKKDEIGKAYLNGDEKAETPKYYALYKDGDSKTPVIEAGTDVGCPFSYKVQGTSSEAYVISAANLDSNFKKGFIDSEGNKISKFQLDDSVPGENYFNSKVNVASCEGANNALNAAWYNDYQPYESAAKAQNKKKRDTMLFKPGLIFIKDENPNYELSASVTSNLDLNIFKEDNTYKNSPFHKMYAICNFGNSKKNKATLHDENNPSEICIEVTDNQNVGQHMCQVSGRREVNDVDSEGKPITKLQDFDITNEEISYEWIDKVNDDGEIEKDADGNPIKILKGNSTYDAFYLSMDDNDYDVRYTSGTDGVDNATPEQIKGFFNLVKWFALNDPSPYHVKAHPHGYTEERFDETTPNAILYNEPEILIAGDLYLDDKGEQVVLAKDLVENQEYYKAITVVIGTTEDGQDITDIAYVLAENGVDYRLTGYGVTFPPYTFKEQITFKTGSGFSHTYDSKLGGLRVSTYAKTYFKDSHEYRMAKLLSECEDHLIMDSIIYHYLFIEKHLMVDNVAKNTFWTSEDKNNQYWSLIKDYDNDTADGIDNDGKLSFTYGIEPTDKQPGGLSYFNAPNTVWFNFIHGLETVRQHLYTALSSGGSNSVWNVQNYLDKFDEWQSSIPERCWIEDYYRKYIRPYELFNNTSYLAKLEGGQKRYQRRQFEIYQNDYLNSKYRFKDGESIYLRANEEQPSRISIPVKMYSDCYVYQSWSQNIVRSRVKRGETYTIKVPSTISRLDDATVYWYLPQTYSVVGDLGVINPKGITTDGARRLQSLDVTNQIEGELISLKNENSLSIGQATLLRHLKLVGLKSETGTFPLDLKNLKSLQDFNGSKSLFTSIEFPIGAPLRSITINNPKIISMRELHQLEELTIEDFDNLQFVLIDNIDDNEAVNSLSDIVLKANNLTQYCLHNVKWTLKDSTHINDSGIDFLNILAEKTPVDIVAQNKTSPKEALTGTLTITKEAYSGNKSLELYNKYNEIFPNLEIIFEAPECALYEVSVLDGNEKVRWKKKFKESTILSAEFFDSSGFGKLEDIILNIVNSKASTTYNSYNFANIWDCNGKEIFVSPTKNEFEEPIPSTYMPYSLDIYKEDVIIKPVFNEYVRTYRVDYHLDPTTNDFLTFYPSAGTPVITPDWYTDKFPMEYIYPTRDSSDLKETEAYRFIGWSLTEKGDIFKGYDNLKIESNYTFYAQYEVVDFMEDNGKNRSKLVLDEKYFDIFEKPFPLASGDSITSEITQKTLPNETVKKQGVYIAFKEGFNKRGSESLTKGKIFLPTYIYGKPVYGLLKTGNGTGVACDNVTHIYWDLSTTERPIEVYQLGNHAFFNWKSLQYFEVPETLKVIDVNTFSGCIKLKMPFLINSSIKWIGRNAFSGCHSLENIIIPGTLDNNSNSKSLGHRAFYSCDTYNLQLGTIDKPINFNLQNIDGMAFYNGTILNLVLYVGTTDITETSLSNADSIFGSSLNQAHISTN